MASVTLKQDNKYNELTMKCRMLMGQLQKLDTTVVIEPVIAGNKKGRWEKSSEILFNFTDLGAAIKVAGNARFEKVKPWGNKAKNTDWTEAALIDPGIYFDFAFSCDQDPETILDAIRIEWRRQGGNRLDMGKGPVCKHRRNPSTFTLDWTTKGDFSFRVTSICTQF